MYAKHEDNPEQSRILRQLKVMFSAVPHWRLRQLCKANNWHLDSCIQQLMEMDDDMKDGKISQQPSCTNSKFNKDEERIGSLIRRGYRVMVLMRGPPGVGKSYLARSLVSNFVDLDNYGFADFICSSDDYFYNTKGEYKYNKLAISDAHDFNHQRVKDKAISGLSPIIVDNTNMQLWEMLPYVKFAVQNNYLIEILEPKTPWRNSTSALAEKNKHGVAKNRIQHIMEKYEKGTVASLTKMLKNTKYSKTLPQMRLLPPINAAAMNSEIVEKVNNSILVEELMEEGMPQAENPIVTVESKEQRTKFKSSRLPTNLCNQEDSAASSTRNVYNLLEKKTTNAWKPFESESADFWGIKSFQQQEQDNWQLEDLHKSVSSDKSLLDLLRENSDDAANKSNPSLQDDRGQTKCLISFDRHSINCPNENVAFVSLRQVYPNKRVSGLWDLFVKCNGDVDWAVDILLKEDELEMTRCDEDVVYQTEDDELFECLCKIQKCNSGDNMNEKTKYEESIPSKLHTDAKPQRHRSRFSRFNERTNPTLMDLKENIENCFVLGDDLYSQHLLRIRNIRSGTNEETTSSNTIAESSENVENSFLRNECSEENIENEDNDFEEGNESEKFIEDMLEISLGEQLIHQLVDTFKNESSIEQQISSVLPLNSKVFMPRSLAKQLYMVWLESAFNHLEEERRKSLKDDEDFARLLENPKYSEFKQSPNNIREILDMEYAWNIYYRDKKKQQRDIELEELHLPKDLASHLTQMKLCETFPDIPRETLLDILVTNGNDYNATVAVLRSTMNIDNGSTTQDHLMEYARREKDLVSQQLQHQMNQRHERISNNWDEHDRKSALSPDESKRLALREFEESRNLAAHHCQLKAECYQKAKEAIQNGNGGAAIYYSQIANLHIKKIDMYNHRAANCIMDVHKNTQNNPDLLDLHYLYLIEALGCLDLFLDRHITGLRVASRNYKHVFIITGRGKHSAGGVSTIKNKVKARLKERGLRWSEVNPGLLKVKIFSGSRHSKNI